LGEEGEAITNKTSIKRVASISPLEIGGLVVASGGQWGFEGESRSPITQWYS